MSGPGILWVNSKITKPDAVSPELFTRWYEEVHIPDIFATSGIKSAVRYQNIDPKAERPYLAVYAMKDIAFLQTDEFKAISVHSDMLPGPSHACFDIADFDTRYYEAVQTYEAKDAPAGPARMVISAGLTPAPGTDDDFDKWYREEHCRDLAKCPGYRRTRRFKLTFGRQNRLPATEKKIAEPPKYLALHEFDVDELPAKELAATGETPWATKIMGGCVQTEVGIFKILKEFGDVKAKF